MSKVITYKNDLIQYVKDCKENVQEANSIVEAILNDNFNSPEFRIWYMEEQICADKCGSYEIVDMIKYIRTAHHNKLTQRSRRRK